MKSTLVAGALALAALLFVAACGDSNPTPAASPAATTAGSPATTSPTVSTDDSMAGMDMGSDDSTAGMDMGHEAPAVGLRLAVDAGQFDAAQPSQVSFTVVTADGNIVNSYQVEQTKELHFVIVRSDLTGYQHLHPTRAADGTWTTPVTFAQGGKYRLVADFVPVLDGVASGRTSVTADLTVNGSGVDTPLPSPTTSVTTADGFTVTLAGSLISSGPSTLTFHVVDGAGAPAKLEPYLGAFGHLVAFAQSDLAYTHIHPSSADEGNGTLTFEGQVVAPGPHRLFLQFSTGGQVRLAEFTVNVS